MKVVILHGTKGSPEGSWFPWLKAELEKLGHEVYVPKLPTPEGQSVESWCEVLQEQCPWTFGQETMLIGHSAGAAFMLNILNRERPEPVFASIFVGGFLSELGNPEYDELNSTFMHQDFDWAMIRRDAGEVAVFCGSDDPYVPMEQSKELARKLDVKPTVIEGGGHLNAEFGYTEFPQLLRKIKEFMKAAG
jgi:predicted alpha/beta hydrolase family esterase